MSDDTGAQPGPVPDGFDDEEREVLADVRFPVYAPEGDHLTDPASAVDGIGPSYGLINKITSVQAALAANAAPGSCSILGAFIAEIEAQPGKKNAVATAAALTTDADRIKTVLGC